MTIITTSREATLPMHSAAVVSAADDRRAHLERRRYSLETLRRQLLAPRRSHGRRHEDRCMPVTDYFDSGLLFMAVLLVGLSIVDSTFTLILLANGGREVNPFMDLLMQHSLQLFMNVKMLLTAIPAVLLVATANLEILGGRLRARAILGAVVGMYLGLIVYEIGLLNLVYR